MYTLANPAKQLQIMKALDEQGPGDITSRYQEAVINIIRTYEGHDAFEEA